MTSHSHLTDTRAFFGPRAAGWDERFPDDRPAFESAVAELHLHTAAIVVDVGAGTGRALPVLREAAGPAATVVGLDPVPEMLAVAGARRRWASLVQGDAMTLPFADGSVDAVLASGLLPHLPDVGTALTELARAVRPGGALAVFHPISRDALAARHGRTPQADDPLDPANLLPLLVAHGWTPDLVDDGGRYLVVARRAVRLGERAVDRLRDDELLWLTTVDDRGQPQTSPLWFLWRDGALLVATQPDSQKVANLAGHQLVSVHLDGRHVVTLEGIARVVGPLDDRLRSAYLDKYAGGIARLDRTPERYFAEFSATVRIVPTRARVYDSA